jgi:hypothetical protein
MEFGKLSPLDLANALRGVAPYGFRHIDSPSEMSMPKGKGYFGALPMQGGGVATEISASNEGGSFPLLTPNLSKEQLNYLLQGNQPTDDIYRNAEQHADMRRMAGQSPFASPFELRYPKE